MNVFDLAIEEALLASDFRAAQKDTNCSHPVFLIVVNEDAIVSAFMRLIETLQRTDFEYLINSVTHSVMLYGIRISVVSSSSENIRGETLIGAVLDAKVLRDNSDEEALKKLKSLHIGMMTMRHQGFPAALVTGPVM